MDNPEAAIRANYAQQREAMVAGDADALGALLADGFTLTHMTGYLQPKQEWLADVRTGRMTYHAMDDVEVTVDRTVLTARTVTEATIWGGHGTWRLQLEITYAHDGREWLPTASVASTW